MLGSYPAQADVSIEAGGVVSRFGYKEVSDSGATFNAEKGTLPGVFAGLLWQQPGRGWLSLSATRYSGDVRYNGQTQAGAPLKTHTDTRRTFFDVRAGGPEFQLSNIHVTPLLQVGFRQWQRDIQPTRVTRALNEVYRWYELGLGLGINQQVSWGWVDGWRVEGWALHSAEGSVEVNLTGFGAGKPSLRLGSKPGARVEAAFSAGPVELKVFGHFWQFGKSNVKEVERRGGRLSITEPASQSWLTGFEVNYRFTL